LPRLNCTFKEFIAIIEGQGFVLHRHGATSHRRYRRVVGNEVYYVDVAGHNSNDVIAPSTLASMIRQSGLPKRLFRK
jgi:predicted RNA binding protein YcfA (HicA-like mRNA interferase family)